jgi:hypothetical protein
MYNQNLLHVTSIVFTIYYGANNLFSALSVLKIGKVIAPLIYFV